MSDVLVTGAGGFIGRSLVARLQAGATLCDGRGQSFRPRRLVLCDTARPEQPPPLEAAQQRQSRPSRPSRPGPDGGPVLDWRVGSVADRDFVESLADEETACVFHLAGIVSGAAETDFDAGLRVNFDGTRNLLETLRLRAGLPNGSPGPVRLVHASSIAVYGAPTPARIDDDTQPWPALSYGAQKLASELLIGDMSRRGLLDGRSVRLSGVVVRPPQPNGALSAFNSDLIREPLAGRPVVSPVSPAATIWLQSIGRTVDNLLHAMALDAGRLGAQRAVLLPALACRIDEIVDAVATVAGADAARLVSYRPDDRIEPMFGRWPRPFTATRALDLGFGVDDDLVSLIRNCAAR
jgi:nucleoside-diphosphate-sugar epimerase